MKKIVSTLEKSIYFVSLPKSVYYLLFLNLNTKAKINVLFNAIFTFHINFTCLKKIIVVTDSNVGGLSPLCKCVFGFQF